MKYLEKFRTETELIAQYTESKAFIVWSMGLYLDNQDLEKLANDNLTDKADDHGIDFLRFDEDDNTIYIVQSYYTVKVKDNPPASKASDLMASCAWLINGEISFFHPTIQQNIKDARDAILAGTIQKIVLIYLHDCGESKEVVRELDTAKSNLAALLEGKEIEVLAIQMGNESLERMFQNQAANIILTDTIECPFPIMYRETDGNWQAAVLSINGQWLREKYLTHSGDLFSANYRGYLGNARQKINSGIKYTAERKPQNFWAFNNGITILTTQIEERGSKTILHGMSIINGAQTTGSLGAIPISTDLSNTKILSRIIACSDPDTISDIVKYNNTQNKITAWDSFSNDTIQIQLRDEFLSLGHNYNIKRGFSNRESLLSVEAAIQPLLSISGKYKDANRSKTYIFESSTLYKEAFEHRSARNVLFACCLNTCLQVIKSENKQKVESGYANDTEKSLHNILAVIKYKFYLLSIVAESLHKLVPTLSETKRISFAPNEAKNANYEYNDLVEKLKPIVNLVLPHIVNSLGADYYSKYNEVSSVESIAVSVETSITSIKAVVPTITTTLDEVSCFLCNG